MYRKSKVDNDFFDYIWRRNELIKKRKLNFVLFYGGRNLGKTTRVFRTEFQDVIAEYKSTGKQPNKIGIIIRTEKTWNKIKGNFLANLRQFGIDFMIEGTKIYYITPYVITLKDGTQINKLKREFIIGEILFLWSANSYKLMNMEDFKCLIFDEIIPEIDGYIPDEIAKFETLTSTFVRLRSSVYLIGICNKVDDNSMYFSYYGANSDTLPQEENMWINETQGVAIENVKTPQYIKDEQAKSTAGQLQKGTAYGEFAQGGVLNSSNYAILTKPSGEYLIKYNIWFEGMSYRVYQYSKTAYWIIAGNDPYVKDYYLDQFSANKNGEPFKFIRPSSLISDYRYKLSKDRLWFGNVEVRDVFFDFLNNYDKYVK